MFVSVYLSQSPTILEVSEEGTKICLKSREMSQECRGLEGIPCVQEEPCNPSGNEESFAEVLATLPLKIQGLDLCFLI